MNSVIINEGITKLLLNPLVSNNHFKIHTVIVLRVWLIFNRHSRNYTVVGTVMILMENQDR